MRSRFALPFVLMTLLAACAAVDDETDQGDDVELSGQVDLKADRAAAASKTATYYDVTRDARKCASPDCGGYWVSRVNFKTTTCSDGQSRSACYVAGIDLENGIGLGDDEAGQVRADIEARRIVLRGAIKKATYGDRVLGFFVPTEAWRAATTQAASGIVYKVTDRNIVCIAAPCPVFEEAKLNSTIQKNIDHLDLEASGADPELLNAAWSQLDQEPLLVAGQNQTFTTLGQNGTSLAAAQVWTRVARSGLSVATLAARDLGGRAYGDLLVGSSSYPRVYRFAADGTVVVEDRVATCPAGQLCIWSGLVTRPATWTVSGDRIVLAYSGAASPGQGTGSTIRYFGTLLGRKDMAGKLLLLEQGDDGTMSGRQFRE